MSGYEHARPLNKFGSHVTHQAIGAPPGTSMQVQLLELLRGLPEQLNLASVGISTPWGTPVSDLEWSEIRNPDTNVQTFLLSESALKTAKDVFFGQPIPFVLIKTTAPRSRSEVEAALTGSPYEFFETQGVYRQDDPNPVPRIEFHHWARRRPLDKEGNKSMDLVASQLRGDLLYGQQIPVEGTTLRGKPVVSFPVAYGAQFLTLPPDLPGVPNPFPGIPNPLPGLPDFPLPDLPFPVPVPPPAAPPPPPPAASTPAQMPFWGPLLVAGTVAVATVVIWQGAKEK